MGVDFDNVFEELSRKAIRIQGKFAVNKIDV